MPIRLITSAGKSDILVDRMLVAVGRHPQCDSRIVSPQVSRWHCCLTEVNGEVWVRDMGSTNGTWINGRRVMSGRVRPGDVLAIAHVRYQLEEDQADRENRADSRVRLEEGSFLLADPHGTALCDESDGG
jgi:pSer/pThr/pTyr-binding forkhead associated (FHA) protein